MQVFVRLRLPDDRLVDAVPGDLVGRMPTAAVRLNDPRISEAHALISLRGRHMRLLALRGRFAVLGTVTSDVVLTSGLVVQFAPGLDLVVVAVTLADSVIGFEGPRAARQILPPVASLYTATGAVVPGFAPDASALLWVSGRALHLRVLGRPDAALAPEDTFELDGGVYRTVSIARANTLATERGGDLDAPLLIVLRFDSVHIHREGTVTAISGLPARLLTELGLIGVPVEWRTLARLLWPEEAAEDGALRSRFDRVLARLRQSLREAKTRPDLARTDGSGRLELLLGPRDRLKDET